MYMPGMSLFPRPWCTASTINNMSYPADARFEEVGVPWGDVRDVSKL